jgi:hypothetical protein
LPIAPDRRSHKNLCAFLQACSAPIFPEKTTASALTVFGNAHFKPRQFRKRAVNS